MLDIRRAESRGSMQTDWLDAKFSFSFGPYRDPSRNAFGALVALNEDRVQPRGGFPSHPHEDLEIFILPLEGAVEHRDSLGNYGTVRPGEVQKMRAGSGIWHSQMNPCLDQIDHHLQIWLKPKTCGLAPGVEQRFFAPAARQGRWQKLLTPDGHDGSFSVDQDAILRIASLAERQSLHAESSSRRSSYIHVIAGQVKIKPTDGQRAVLSAGDALAMASGEDLIVCGIESKSELLWFDLPALSTA